LHQIANARNDAVSGKDHQPMLAAGPEFLSKSGHEN
jgi:hypothetical protein